MTKNIKEDSAVPANSMGDGSNIATVDPKLIDHIARRIKRKIKVNK